MHPMASYPGRFPAVALAACLCVGLAACGPSVEDQLLTVAGTGDTREAERLLKQDVDVDARDRSGRTALHYAAKAGETNMVKLLLEHGADANPLDRRQWTPLHHASVGGYTAICNLLVDAGADISAQTLTGSTPLSLAWMNDHRQLAIILRMRGGKMSPDMEQDPWMRDQLDHIVKEQLRLQERMAEQERLRRNREGR